MAAVARPETTAGLRRNAIGLREVLFQSITDMAPGAAIAASIPAGVAFAGGSLPLAVVFALIACLFCASNWPLHVVIPVLGIITFVPAWLTAAGIDVFSFIAPLAPPYSYMGPGVAGFMVLGVIYLIYLYRTDPRRVTEVGLVHLDELEVGES